MEECCHKSLVLINFYELKTTLPINVTRQHIHVLRCTVYLVDFKCSGYETEQGKLLEEKEVTSPYPFLDMAARLIMQLAEAD